MSSENRPDKSRDHHCACQKHSSLTTPKPLPLHPATLRGKNIYHLVAAATNRQLRILDLHRPARTEIVVNVWRLLDEAIFESREIVEYEFRLLYCSQDIISCLYTYEMPNRILPTRRDKQIWVFTAHFMVVNFCFTSTGHTRRKFAGLGADLVAVHPKFTKSYRNQQWHREFSFSLAYPASRPTSPSPFQYPTNTVVSVPIINSRYQ